MKSYTNFELETAKAAIARQFNDRKSPIKYSMLVPDAVSYKFLSQSVFYLEGYDAYVKVQTLEGTNDVFQTNFIDSKSANAEIKQTAELLKDVLLKQKFIKESINVDGYYLHFYLDKFEVDFDDNDFFTCNHELTHYVSIILTDVIFQMGAGSVPLELRYWDQFRYFKNEERFIPFDKRELQCVIETLEHTKLKEHIDSNKIDILISIFSSYEELDGPKTLHEIIDKINAEFILKNKR